MSSYYVRQNQQIVRDYVAAGGIWPATKAEIAEWALQHDRWKPSRDDILRLCGEAITGAMSEEVFTDERGRTVRAKIAARTERDGMQGTFWHDLREAPINFVRMNVAQRRNAIAAECFHLSNVVTYSNEHHEEQIELDLDFARDVREMGQELLARPTHVGEADQTRRVLPVQVQVGLADMVDEPQADRPVPSLGARILPPSRAHRPRAVLADDTVRL